MNEWNYKGLKEHIAPLADIEFEGDEDPDTVAGMVEKAFFDKYESQREELGDDFAEAQRVILLRSVDRRWMDHIDDMDELKRGIGLEAYGQRDPAQEFKFRSYDIFNEMTDNIKNDTVRGILSVKIRREEDLQREEVAKDGTESHGGGEKSVVNKTVVNKNKVGRNDPCPCGSGKKYKKCCGANE